MIKMESPESCESSKASHILSRRCPKGPSNLILIYPESGSVQPSSTSCAATEARESSLTLQELITENTKLKEALLRSRERGMQWLQFYAALKAVEVEAERRYKDVGTILEGLGYEVPVYPQRVGNEDITRETERWRVIFTERWMELERAEEAMFLPMPTNYSADGRFTTKGLKVDQEPCMKMDGENVWTGEDEGVGLKRKRIQP